MWALGARQNGVASVNEPQYRLHLAPSGVEVFIPQLGVLLFYGFVNAYGHLMTEVHFADREKPAMHVRETPEEIRAQFVSDSCCAEPLIAYVLNRSQEPTLPDGKPVVPYPHQGSPWEPSGASPNANPGEGRARATRARNQTGIYSSLIPSSKESREQGPWPRWSAGALHSGDEVGAAGTFT